MRKFFFGLGVVTAVLIGFGAVSLFVLSRNGAALDTQSKSYVEDSVVSIATGWNADELWKRASPHLRKITTHDDMQRFFAAAKDALGPLVEYRGARGEAMMSLVNSTKTVSARYVAKGKFKNGDADFQIALVKIGPEWMVEGFHINSTVLMRSMVGARS